MRPALLFVAAHAAGAAAQAWVGNYHRLRIERPGNSGGPWTIHGLWPEWEEAAQFYCRDDPFRPEEVAHLRTRLNRDWPSNSGNNEGFWKHEWEKHGTCMDPPDNQQRNYFEKTLELFDATVHECDAVHNDWQCNICWERDLVTRCVCDRDTPGRCGRGGAGVPAAPPAALAAGARARAGSNATTVALAAAAMLRGLG